MQRWLVAAILFGTSSYGALDARADHDFPVLNSLGRYFGTGYTLGGYHAGPADGRLAHSRPLSQPRYHAPFYASPFTSQTSTPAATLWAAPSPARPLTPAASSAGCGCHTRPPHFIPSAMPTPAIVPTDEVSPSDAPRQSRRPVPVAVESTTQPSGHSMPSAPPTPPADSKAVHYRAAQLPLLWHAH